MGKLGDRSEVDGPNRLVPVHDGRSAEVSGAIAEDVAALGAACRTGVISDRRVSELRSFVEEALSADLAWHDPDDDENAGRVTFLPRYGALPLFLLDDDGVMDPVVELFGPDTELYTMTTACQSPGFPGRRIHVDVTGQPPEYVLALGVIVLLDDFDDTSGPTRFFPEVTTDLPTDEEFAARSRRLHAPAGSVCWFNAGVWHDVLPNRGTSWRHSILIAMGRPGRRPRFDMPRMLSHLELDGLPRRVKRRLGLLSLPPGSYEEYYLSDEVRHEAILRGALDRC